MNDKITVIIPTYNAMMLLKDTLDGFLVQTLNKDRFEIIVVDDGSKDGTKYLVDEYRDAMDISYYYLEDMGYRLSAARNVGIKFAKHPISLIFDCGMLPSKSLLKKHVEEHQGSEGARVIVGLSYGVEEFSMEKASSLSAILNKTNRSEIFDILQEVKSHYDCRYEVCQDLKFDIKKHKASWVMCWGGHLSCKTHVLREIGGFDEWFNSWGGEDVDLAIRLFEYGADFHLLKTQEAIHIPHFRCEDSNKSSSLKNIEYIISKHNVDGVELLKDYGWEDIMSKFSVGEPSEEEYII